jgi:hypothetical protein
MAFDRNAALQAGYSEEEIDAYLREEASKKKTAPAPVAEADTPPDSTTVVPEAGGGVAGAATTAGLAVGGPVISTLIEHPVLSAVGASYIPGVNKLPVIKDIKAGREAAQSLYNRFTTPAAPQSAPVGSPTNPIGGNAPLRPVAPTGPAPTAPVAPAAPAPAVAPQAAAGAGEASLIDKTTAMIRQLAANKVLGNMVKGGVGAGLAMYSPDLGPAVPSVGRLKGSEINPLTGAPWTKEQIQQYESNPNMFDAQLPAPQMRR